MFIYMYVYLHFRIDIKSVVSPDLKGRFFFGCRLKMVFSLCHEEAWNVLSFIMYFKTWNFRHWWSKQYPGWSFMYPLYVMAHYQEIYSYVGELKIVKSDGLRFESLRGKLRFSFPPLLSRFRDEWIRSIFLSFFCLMSQIIPICIFSQYSFISSLELGRH